MKKIVFALLFMMAVKADEGEGDAGEDDEEEEIEHLKYCTVGVDKCGGSCCQWKAFLVNHLGKDYDWKGSESWHTKAKEALKEETTPGLINSATFPAKTSFESFTSACYVEKEMITITGESDLSPKELDKEKDVYWQVRVNCGMSEVGNAIGSIIEMASGKKEGEGCNMGKGECEGPLRCGFLSKEATPDLAQETPEAMRKALQEFDEGTLKTAKC